jgi:hypothetical protein
VLAAVLFPTKKGKSVTVCIEQILDIDDQEFQLKYMKKWEDIHLARQTRYILGN